MTAITKGQRPDGRLLAPIMPSHAFANLTPYDSRAIVAFLKSLPPVKNKVPGPFGSSEKPTSFCHEDRAAGVRHNGRVSAEITARVRRAMVATMSGMGVRRDKAALSSGCKSHPATAPAGSNRSSYGGNEVAEAFG